MHLVISINGKKGSCLFFHCRLIHGSSHNISGNDRKVLLCDISSKKHFESANMEKIKTFNRKERIIFEKKELLKRLKVISWMPTYKVKKKLENISNLNKNL